MRRIILGIDPGSRVTGYGLVWTEGSQQGCIGHGCIRTVSENFSDRLHEIYVQLKAVIQEHQPDEAAIEQVFMQKNVQSALKLGQARGAAMVALATCGLAVAEYSAREIKQATVGYGAASKAQMQSMICSLLQLKATPPSDAADALAIALCHANCRLLKQRLAKAGVKMEEIR